MGSRGGERKPEQVTVEGRVGTKRFFFSAVAVKAVLTFIRRVKGFSEQTLSYITNV